LTIFIKFGALQDLPNKNKLETKMVLVDLDGTLLNNERKIGDLDFQTLGFIGDLNVVRVFATGRNLYSALNVLPDDTPFDYLIFSSGAGIINWKSRELLFKSTINREMVLMVEKKLKDLKLNFSIHFPVPENHKYYYFKGNTESADFDDRNSIYKGFSSELVNGFPLDYATQFLVILNQESEFQFVASHIEGLKIIRATSPIDGKSVWLEIFNNNVSKALGGIFLCSKLNIPENATVGIGNDYNDIDLLNWTAKSYMVENAPEILKQNFLPCVSNQNNPLTMVINQLMT
jgi:hydroxymethylpyrimidine pyrophosphatase-like HAD family hydrolase